MKKQNMKKLCRLLLITVMTANVVGCADQAVKPESLADQATDCDLANRVHNNLVTDPSLKKESIVIKCYEGRVCLSGHVTSAAEEADALKLAREVPGALWVEDDLIIFPVG